jgi:uncharacterized protein with HEPN domain
LTDEDRDWFHLRQILRMIADIERRLEGFDEERFLADRDERDLTCFRLQVLGEAAGKVSDRVKLQYTGIEWRKIVAMRNVIAHDYEGLSDKVIWQVARRDLTDLARICRDELGSVGLADL